MIGKYGPEFNVYAICRRITTLGVVVYHGCPSARYNWCIIITEKNIGLCSSL